MDKTPSRTLGHLAALVTTAVFVVAICIPATANLLKVNPYVPLQEAKQPLPALNLDVDSLGQVTYQLRRNWLDRNFGLRKVLVRWQHILDVRLLKASMPTDPVLAGNDDWLYLAQENPFLNVMDDYRVVRPLTQAELDVWVKVFTARKDWLAERGIRYMVLVAPNKANIYPEHIPARFNRAHETTKLDQMVRALGAAGVEVVDLRPALTRAKALRLSYYRTDSHWTPYGAFQAYRLLAERLGRHFPGLTPLSLDDFEISEKPGLLGGLCYMIAMGDYYRENIVVMDPKYRRTFQEVTGSEAQLNHFQPLGVYENENKSLPRIFFFRDSFLHEMIPFLAEHFSRMYLQWPFPTDARRVREFDTKAIEREKPDMVVDQFVERYFTQAPPPAALADLPAGR